MRSGTSSFNPTVFKKTVGRFWPVWAAYFVAWFIVLPMNGLMLLSIRTDSDTGYGYMENFACRTVPGTTGLILTLAVVFGLLAAMAVCSHLYGSKSANFFGALPVRREGLFLTHYLAGLAFLLVPNLAIALLTLLIEAVGGWVSVQGLLFWLAVSCGECFLFYSMAVFCAMFTGHLLALPVFYGVFNVLFAGVYALFTAMCRAFYYGYAGSSWSWGYELAQALTPVWRLNASVFSIYRSAEGSGIPSMAPVGEVVTQPTMEFAGLNLVGMYAVGAAVLAVASFFLYRARRLESAGDVVSVRPMRPVFKYGVALCSGLAFGVATTVFLNTGEVGLMVGIVIWGIVGYFVAQMLLDKSFRVFKKWKGAAAVAGVFAALFLVVGLDLTGFETRMPDPAGVESVYFSGLDAVGLGDSGDYVSQITTDQGQIALLTDLHQAAIGQRGMWRPNGGYSTDLRHSTNLDLSYTMKDGSTLSRQYTVWLDPDEVDQEGTAAWALQQLYNDRDLYWEDYGFGQMDQLMAEEGWWMEQARYTEYYYSDKYYDDYYYDEDSGEALAVPVDMPQDRELFFYGKNAQALYEAVKEDFLAGRIGVRQLSEENLSYDRDCEREICFTAVNGRESSTNVHITVQDSASSTLAALEELEQG